MQNLFSPFLDLTLQKYSLYYVFPRIVPHNLLRIYLLSSLSAATSVVVQRKNKHRCVPLQPSLLVICCFALAGT